MGWLLSRLCLLLGLRISRTPEGLLISRRLYHPGEAEKRRWFDGLSVKTVIDVGAHVGESAVRFGGLFPEAAVYSFEPLKDCFRKLEACAPRCAAFRAFNVALSDFEGQAVLYRSRYAPSSSLLRMTARHALEFEHSAGAELESARVTTLDKALEPLAVRDEVLLKIDAQGAEDRILRGGEKTLARAKVVVIETSFVELYEGQPLFRAIHELLTARGFDYAGSMAQWHGPKSGAPLQQDSVFVRKQ